MIMALRMQQAVDDEVQKMVAERFALGARLGANDGHANDDVRAHRRFHVVEGEHICGVILTTELAVQPAPFLHGDETQDDDCVALEREQRPAPQRRPRGQVRERCRALDRKYEAPGPPGTCACGRFAF